MPEKSYLRVCSAFQGLDTRLRAEEGHFAAMKNLSLEEYPLITTRRLRGEVLTVRGLLGMTRLHVLLDGALRDALCIITASHLYYYVKASDGSLTCTSVLHSFSTAKKQLVIMGTRLLIFPDRKLVDAAAPLTVTAMSASVPEMDFVCEAGNRLWGCRYGVQNGVLINELYASALNDPEDFTSFEGISTDSWRASCGTDGPFTGCTVFQGSPVFFKERSVTRVYVSGIGAHKTAVTELPGVQQGSGASLCALPDRLLYKGVNAVYQYDGSDAIPISEPLGQERFTDASAGLWKGVYYVSMVDAAGSRRLFTYDIRKGFWCEEDNIRAESFTEWDGELFFLSTSGENRVLCANGTRWHPAGLESGPDWYAVTPPLPFGGGNAPYAEQDYRLRLELAAGASAALSAEYDSSGVWETLGTVNGSGLGLYEIRAVPRLCEHLRLKLSGSGSMKLWSISRVQRTAEKGFTDL